MVEQCQDSGGHVHQVQPLPAAGLGEAGRGRCVDAVEVMDGVIGADLGIE